MTLSSAEKLGSVCPWKFPLQGDIVLDDENCNQTNCGCSWSNHIQVTDVAVMGNANSSPKANSCAPVTGCNPLSNPEKRYVQQQNVVNSKHQNHTTPLPLMSQEKKPLIQAVEAPLTPSKVSLVESGPAVALVNKNITSVQTDGTKLLGDLSGSKPGSQTTTPVMGRKPAQQGRESPVPPLDITNGRSGSSNSLRDSQAKDIMISYSHLDKEIMVKLKDALESHNVSVWVDVVGLNAGVNFLNKIGQAIIDSKMFITLLTERTLASKFCQDELALAYISNKPIFPVSLQPQEEIFPRIPTGMKLQLARFEWTQISLNNFDADFGELLHKLKACLSDLEGLSSEGMDDVSPLGASVSPATENKLSRKPVLKKRSTRTKIYSKPNRSLSRCNSIIEQTEDIDSSAEFWDRNFGDAKCVSWDSFEVAFMKDYERQLNMTYALSDREWFIEILKRELDVEHLSISKDKYKDFITEEVDGKTKEQPILKCVNDLAVENYTMREVFNMDSSVRLDAINNLAKFGSPAVVEALLDLLDDQEHDVRASACISLAKTKAGCLGMKVERLMRCLRDSDRFVRESACIALGYLKADTAVPPLLQIWRNDYISSVREAAELALQQIGGDEVNRAMQMTKVLTAEINDLIKVLTGKNTSPKNIVVKKWGPMNGPMAMKAYTLPHLSQNTALYKSES